MSASPPLPDLGSEPISGGLPTGGDVLAVEARGLVKSCGTNRAVDGIDLVVREGEIFCVLGPNGAGKTTTLQMLATLLPIDGGSAEIFGHDVQRQPHAVRQLIGVTGQYASVDELLTGRENLRLFGRLQGLSQRDARSTGDDLLARFDLTEAADRYVMHYSGGMRRRLDLAASLLTRPALIFLDEPTTGLDPRTRGQMWETIRTLVADGCTILLTTQYLDEADQLADRIAVIDRGHNVLTQTTAMAWRALLKMRRNPEQLVDVTVMPLLLTTLFAFMFGGAVAGGMVAYLPTLIPGIVAYGAITACVAAGTQLREDMDKGVFDRFRSLPIARIAPLAGPMLADLIRYALAATITLTMGIVLGYRPGGGVPGVAAGVLLAMLTGWSLAWVFMFIGTIAKNASSVSSLSLVVMLPLTFVSNAFVPIDTLPSGLQTIVRLNPVSLVITALRDLMNDAAVTAQVGYALLGCAIVVAVFLPLTVRSYSKKV